MCDSTEPSAASRSEQIQVVQTRHRRSLLATWPNMAGARVLEVGCGQGDMTAVLAEAVGAGGHVTAVDNADRDYGAPLTLGQATDALRATSLGERIEFQFEFDVLAHQHAFEAGSFDYVVLAHSSWYFESREALGLTLSALRRWAKVLCLAEWDMQPRRLEQLPHLLAVLLQGQVESLRAHSRANVRTPLLRSEARALCEAAGWQVSSQQPVVAGGMQDADWEIAECRRYTASELGRLGLPAGYASIVSTQAELMKELALTSGNVALDCYSMVLT